MNTKNFTILHSNDIHGDFLAEIKQGDSKLIGGLSLLSGYINRVRKEEENVLFVIAGDILQGSIIDTEFKGVSTIEIMNYLAPDVATLGNHEFDYGLPHLLFLEKMANFPTVNANLYIKKYHKRLMQPYVILNKAGFDILFIGIITDDVIDSLKRDEIGSFVSLEQASNEVGRITNAYKNDDIDLTILLTHIGFEVDKELARMLEPEWGIDMINRGHSHTILKKPKVINNILIAQAGIGTDQIGRFDIVVDDDTNSVVDYKWELVPIDDSIAKKDEELEKFIESFKDVIDRKYNTIVTKFANKLTRPSRKEETELGKLFADIFMDRAEVDIAITGSGSIKSKELGPVVILGDLLALFPFNDSISKFRVKGRNLRKIFSNFMSNENRFKDGECYQASRGVRAVYNETINTIESLILNNKEVEDEGEYSISLQGFHIDNCFKNLNITYQELTKLAQPKTVTTSSRDVVEEFLRNHQNLSSKVESRLIYIK